MHDPNATKPIARDEVFAAARLGAVDAVGDLLESYRSYLRLLATNQLRGRLPQRISPSDVVQETMLAAHRGFADFRGQTPGEFSCWLRKILSRKLLTAMDRHLSLKRDVRREVSIDQNMAVNTDASGPTLAGMLATSDPSPSAILTGDEDRQRVTELLQRLPAHYRQVIVLRNKQGMRFEEISPLLERTPLAARLLWLRAIQRLRALYEEDAGDEA